MRAKSVTMEEQYRLVMECRTSGLSDYQWCIEHDIKPGTFYNWIRRLRKRGATDIPPAARGKDGIPNKQEVVQVDFTAPPAEMKTVVTLPQESAFQTEPVTFSDSFAGVPVIEVVMSGTAVRIAQGTDSRFIEQMLHIVKAVSC